MASMVQSSRRAGSASAVPTLVGVGSLVASLVIAVVVATTVSIPVALFFDIPLPMAAPEFGWLSLVGYLLTPVVAIVCIGWDASAQRRGIRQNPNFDLRPRYAKILRWTTVLALILGVWHVLNLSVPLSEWLALS